MKKLKMAYYIAKSHQAVITQFKKLYQFQVKEMKDDVLITHKNTLHGSYTEYTSPISALLWQLQVIKAPKIQRLKSRKPKSLMLDESDDFAHRSQMSLFSRIQDKSGEIIVEFCDLLRVKKKDAISLFELVKAWCLENGIDMKTVFFCGMDTNECHVWRERWCPILLPTRKSLLPLH